MSYSSSVILYFALVALTRIPAQPYFETFAAISMAEKKDTVLLAGKGHENYEIKGKNKLAFDEREVVKEAVRLGFTKIVLPKKNLSASLKVPSGVELVGVSNIYQVLVHMTPKTTNQA